MKKLGKWLLKLAVIVVIAALAWGGWQQWGRQDRAAAPNFRTGTVTVGDLQKTISASGTIEPSVGKETTFVMHMTSPRLYASRETVRVNDTPLESVSV